MIHILVQISKYFMILLFLIYTYECFHVFRFESNSGRQQAIYNTQRELMYVIHFNGFLILFLTSKNVQIIGFYFMQIVLLAGIYLIYHRFYKNSSELVLNNMCMLLCIGMIILTRLSFEKAFRQFVFCVAGVVIAVFLPLIFHKLRFLNKLTWLYAIVGIAALAVVAVAGATSYGAKLSISIGGISIQPSEFVKILYVFFIACMMYKKNDIRQTMITSIVSAIFVLTLVASRDLGGALLFFFTYLVMIYAATQKWYYFAGGLGFLTIAALGGNMFFSHVQNRVLAWKDPLSVIDKEGYQVCQSLFAIGTGGWFGLGLNQGLPNKIPVVEKDFVFSAISEEMGGIFAICIIMVCISCFLMIFNVSMQMKDDFYRLIALGLGSIYALQVFLTIGGVTKFIPSTGVTLPLVSYGGSSLLSTMIIFGVIQGLYILQSEQKNYTNNRNKKKRKKSKKKEMQKEMT